ncbi:MAG: tetratricopeptide repeat protein [Nitrospinota bacterium]|nr:tetratricopeptide repeat protein [Nitrospinota bacterium]
MGLRVLFFAAILASPFPLTEMAQAQTPDGLGASKEYWLGKSGALDPNDPRSRRAEAIFDKVLAAADKRPGPRPEMVILDEDGFPWARSLPDGTILLTRGALEVAFSAKRPQDGDARLAFVIGHELSHQVNGDFWHFFFYQGAHPEEMGDPRARKTLEQMVLIAKSGDSVTTKELQADQYGALYAIQAGYGLQAVVDNDKNFFLEWTQSTSPWLLQGMALDGAHPKIEERTAAVLLALDRVMKKIEIFEKGATAYGQQSLVAARHYFEDFLSVFQSREAYNNLGLVYYAMAIREYALWKESEPTYRLSLILDENTRAKKALTNADDPLKSLFKSAFRGGEPHKTLFTEHIDKALRYFTEAAERDSAYAMARNNLACALFLRERYANSVGELDRALELDPDLAEAYNNRASAYLMMARELGINLDHKVEADLARALSLRPDYPFALFNLAYFYMTRGNGEKAAEYAGMLAKVDPESKLLGMLE